MSNDESSGGKRPKYHHSQPQQPQGGQDQAKDELSGLVNLVHATVPSQKRGAGQPLCTSATEMTSKKARKMSFRNVKKDLSKLQSIKYELEDDDPHMAKAAVYYLLLLEDQLVSKVSVLPAAFTLNSFCNLSLFLTELLRT